MLARVDTRLGGTAAPTSLGTEGLGWVVDYARRAAPLAVRAYRWLLLGQAISGLGGRCYEVALVGLLVALTGSTIIVGTVRTVAYIP